MAETMVAHRKDVAAAITGTVDGEPTPLQTDADGALRVVLGTADSIDIGAVNLLSSADAIIDPATENTLLNSYTSLGTSADAAVAAGAAGTVHGKLRRISTDLGTIDADTGNIATNSATAPVTIGGLVVKYAAIVAPAGAATDIVPAVVGKKIRVISLFGTSDIAGTVKLTDDAPATLTGTMNVGATSGFVLPENKSGWCETTAAKKLILTTVTCVFNGALSYVEV